MSVTVIFKSGYVDEIDDERCLEVFHSSPDDGWWTEITERQNPYDLSDEPVAIIVPDLGRVDLDSDGEWIGRFEPSSVWSSESPEN